MSSRRSFLQSLAALLSAAWADAPRAADGARIALVIGNNSYPTVPLANAANDARLMARVLGEAGFQVQSRVDASAPDMAEAVRQFGVAAQRPEVKLAFFYYAGHAAQVEWRNFLLPVDAVVHSEAELRKATFDLGTVLEVLPRSREKTCVLILDACRDNPFGASFHPDRKGLSQFDAPLGTLIAFSTAPGSVASDGAGGNGLYTENLARELQVRGTRLEDAFKRVRANVSLASRGQQIPWESTSLVGDVFVFPPRAALSEEELERQFEEEVAHWTRIKGSKDPAEWAGLLRAFPNGKLSEIAQARLNLLLAQTSPAATRGIGRTPYCAGSYPAQRSYALDDQAIYFGTLPNEPEEPRRFRRRVTLVDAQNDRVELNDGAFVMDMLGNVIKSGLAEYSVPVQVLPAVLQVGRRWSAIFRAKRRRGTFDEHMSAEVVARETVKVPAGEFDAFRIEISTRGWRHHAIGGKPRAVPRQEEETVWEVPGLNFPVKQRRRVYRPSGGSEDSGYELVAIQQQRKD